MSHQRATGSFSFSKYFYITNLLSIFRAVFLNFEDGEIDSQAVGGPASKPHVGGSSVKVSAASPATASTTEMSLKVRSDLRLTAFVEIPTTVLFAG